MIGGATSKSRTFPQIVLTITILLCVASLCACGDNGGVQRTSSSSKGALSASAPRDCPDVRGSYSAIDPEKSNTSFTLSETMLGNTLPRQWNNPWRVMTISGNADTALTVTFTRPTKSAAPPGDKSVPAYIRQALENPADTPLEKHTVNMTRGAQYECNNGWLASLTSEHRTSLRRGEDGELVASRAVKRARVLSLWAETGAGIPYWYDTETQSARWAATSDSAAYTATLPPRLVNKFEKQARDLEYGPGGREVSDKPYDVDKELRAMIDRDAIVEAIRYEGGRYTLVLRVESRGQVSRTLENLRANPDVKDAEDLGVVSSAKQRDVAMISVRISRS